MKARRIYPPEDAIPAEVTLESGDYAFLPYVNFWIVKAPNGDEGSIGGRLGSGHSIKEHEDGTITVSPSIQFMTGNKWHGYLERGIWRQC